LKDEWNKETFAQELFGIKWEGGGRTEALREYVPNFAWTYGTVKENGEVVNILP
jgi:hypothetical protein